MTQMKTTITIDKDFRKFEKGQVFTLETDKNKILYIAGKNGCGKSTLLQIMRAKLDSLKDITKKEFGGMTDDRIQIAGWEPATIEGFNYDEAFYLDAIIDDPCSFINSATAFSLVNGGGFYAQRQSKGEKSLVMIDNFRKKINKYLTEKYSSIDAWKDSGKHGLVILDETDEGLDCNLQFKWNRIVEKVFITELGLEPIVVTHNPICMLSEVNEDIKVKVFDMFTKIEMKPRLYIMFSSGYDVKLKCIDKQEDNKND